MQNNLLEFKEALKSNEYNAKFEKRMGESGLRPAYLERYTFFMTARMNGSQSKNNLRLIQLDDEDLEYFKNKYLTKEKLEEEMQDIISEIQNQYK